jgi:hypothetical protein
VLFSLASSYRVYLCPLFLIGLIGSRARVLCGVPDFLVLVLSCALQYGHCTVFSGKYCP